MAEAGVTVAAGLQKYLGPVIQKVVCVFVCMTKKYTHTSLLFPQN
jgi:hypothetical protein